MNNDTQDERAQDEAEKAELEKAGLEDELGDVKTQENGEEPEEADLANETDGSNETDETDDAAESARGSEQDQSIQQDQPERQDQEASEVDPLLLARRNELVREETRRNIEAIVLVSTDPAQPESLAELLGQPVSVIEDICEELIDFYEEQDRGFQMVRVAGGYRFQTHPDQADAVKRFVLHGQAGKLSPAALETLAIVAYKQPVSRAQVAAIRGVGVDSVMRTLQQRGYIEEIARDPGPGQAVLYGTTVAFLERMGLDHLDEMPSLGAFVPAPEVLEALEHSLRIESAQPSEAKSGDADVAEATGDAPVGAEPTADTADTAETESPEDTQSPEDKEAPETEGPEVGPAMAEVIDLRAHARSSTDAE